MKMRVLANVVACLVTMTLFGCGGNGSTASSGTPPGNAPGVLTVGIASTTPLPAGTVVNGIDMTISLPPGVTVKADAASGAADPNIFALSGAAAALPNTIVSGKYNKTANTLRVIIVNVQPGFAAGEFMQVSLDGFPTGNTTFPVEMNQVSGGTDPKSPATLTGVSVTSNFAGL